MDCHIQGDRGAQNTLGGSSGSTVLRCREGP